MLTYETGTMYCNEMNRLTYISEVTRIPVHIGFKLCPRFRPVSQQEEMDSTLQTKLNNLELWPHPHLPDSLYLPEPTQATYPFNLF